MTTLIGAEITPEFLTQFEEISSVRRIETPDSGVVTPETLIENVKRFDRDVIVIEETPINDYLLNEAGKLALIICIRGNPINIDLDACRRRGIIVTNAPHRNTSSVAEFTAALMFSMLRRIPEAYMRLRRGEFTSKRSYEECLRSSKNKTDVIWREPGMTVSPYLEFQGQELERKTVGIVGFGGIGVRVAALCRSLGMQIVIHDPYFTGNQPDYATFMSLNQLAGAADIITLHAKETPETIGMINDAFFRNVKRGSYIVNTGRGRLIERSALIHALQSGILAGAALDVFDYEPLKADDPIITMNSVICTPHIAGSSRDVLYHHSVKSWESLSAFAAGTEIPHRIT